MTKHILILVLITDDAEFHDLEVSANSSYEKFLSLTVSETVAMTFGNSKASF